MISAGSPGRSCCSEKISTDTKKSVGINCSRRLARKVSIASSPLPLVGRGRGWGWLRREHQLPPPRRASRVDLPHRGEGGGKRLGRKSLQPQPYHAHQPIGHLAITFQAVGVRDQHLAVIEIEDRALLLQDSGDLLVDRLALLRL